MLRKYAPSRLVLSWRYLSTQPPPADPLRDSQLSLSQTSATDLLQPHLWFPKARRQRRKIICHLGPTNSGKTHRAIEQLKQANNGIYCGPLRLLAWEIFERLNDENIPCSLRTGQEAEEKEHATVVSCTTEMVDVNQNYDVAVIDEIQLIGDQDRGWAWTRALLGLPAQEIHVCGEPAALPIIQRLCEQTQDELIVHEYDRLSPLDISGDAILSLDQVRPGDAVIAFSRRELFSLKRTIEKSTGQNCCIVYGALPPEVRKQQARLFNDTTQSNFSIIVATDAIGMGLNLNIGRVVFSTLRKYDGVSERPLMPNEIKQIGGRAGRFKSIYPEGSVTCLSDDKDSSDWICNTCGGVNFERRTKCFRCNAARTFDHDTVSELRPQGEGGTTGMEFVRKMMNITNTEILTAGLGPTEEHLELFARSTSVLHVMVPVQDEASLALVQQHVDDGFFGSTYGSVVTISKRTTESKFESRQQYEQARLKKAKKKSRNHQGQPLKKENNGGGSGNTKNNVFRPVSVSGTAEQLRFTIEYMLGQLKIDDVWYIAVPTSKLRPGGGDGGSGDGGAVEQEDAVVEDRLKELTRNTEGCIIGLATSNEIATSGIPGTTMLKFTGTQPYGVLEGIGTMCDGEHSLFKPTEVNHEVNQEVESSTWADDLSKWGELLHPGDSSGTEASSSSSSLPVPQSRDVLDLPFSHMLISFHRAVQLDNEMYHMMNVEGMLEVAQLIDHLVLPLPTRFTLCRAPLNLNNKTVLAAFLKYSTCLSNNEETIFPMEVPKVVPSTSKQMQTMESDFKVIECYLWLSRRFPENFPDEDHASWVQTCYQDMMEQGLAQLSEEDARSFLGQRKKGRKGGKGGGGGRRQGGGNNRSRRKGGKKKPYPKMKK